MKEIIQGALVGVGLGLLAVGVPATVLTVQQHKQEQVRKKQVVADFEMEFRERLNNTFADARKLGIDPTTAENACSYPMDSIDKEFGCAENLRRLARAMREQP